ncbi:unnamed protein product [Closterium sp. Naga37s-1]|nr:unnamed protein product [Closterium sp. Naga37s-1]
MAHNHRRHEAGTLITAISRSPVALSSGLLLSLLLLLGQSVPATCQQCRVDQGSWVYDRVYEPAYNGYTCKSIRSYYNCQRNGRNDTGYLKYVWRSPGCDIRRFNPVRTLSILRNKVFMFVGDSFVNNLEISMRCLLETKSVTKDFRGKFGRTGVRTRGFIIPQFNISFLRMPSNFLVRSSPVGVASSAAAWRVHLDRPDPSWFNLLPHTHYVIFSAGHWFINAPSNLRVYYRKNQQLPPFPRPYAPLYDAHLTIRKFLVNSRYSGLPMVMTFSAYHYNNAFSSGDAAKSCMDMRGQVMNGTRMLWAERNTETLQSRDAQVKAFSSYPQFKIVDIARSSVARLDAHQGQLLYFSPSPFSPATLTFLSPYFPQLDPYSSPPLPLLYSPIDTLARHSVPIPSSR